MHSPWVIIEYSFSPDGIEYCLSRLNCHDGIKFSRAGSEVPKGVQRQFNRDSNQYSIPFGLTEYMLVRASGPHHFLIPCNLWDVV